MVVAVVHPTALKKLTKRFWPQSSTPDEPTVRRLKCQMICVNGHVQCRASTSSTG
jgi:hypothetical protein